MTMKKANLMVIGMTIIGFLCASVALAFAGWKPQEIVGLLVAMFPVVGGTVTIIAKTDGQNEALKKIDKQTNSELDARIIQGAKTAIEQHMHNIADTVVEKIGKEQ